MPTDGEMLLLLYVLHEDDEIRFRKQRIHALRPNAMAEKTLVGPLVHLATGHENVFFFPLMKLVEIALLLRLIDAIALSFHGKR